MTSKTQRRCGQCGAMKYLAATVRECPDCKAVLEWARQKSDEVMAMSDEEIEAHVRAQGKDPEKVAAKCRGQAQALIQKAEAEQTPRVVDVSRLAHAVSVDGAPIPDQIANALSRLVKNARPDEAPALRAEVARLQAEVADNKASALKATDAFLTARDECITAEEALEAERAAHEATRKVCREVAKAIKEAPAHCSARPGIKFVLEDFDIDGTLNEAIAALRQTGGAE